MVYLFKRGRNLVGFEITLSNSTGALRIIASIPEKHGLNINFIETCSVVEDTYNLFLAIDFTDSKTSPEELLKEFREEECVFEVSIAPTLQDMIYSSRFCVKDLGGVRAILCGTATMHGLIEGVREEFGEESGDAFLYHIGFGVGKEIYEIYGKIINLKNIEEAAILLKALADGLAWGNIQDYKIDMENDVITVKVLGLWECELQKKRKKHSGNFVRGILAGFFKTLLGVEVVVKENKCIAAGDPYCEFEIDIIR